MKMRWSGIFLLLIILSTQSAYAIERGLIKAFGLQELSGDNKAPDFTLTAPDGKKIGLKDYKGKVVILHFWATWCMPCKQELPLLEKGYRKFKGKDVVFLPISIDTRAGQEEIDGFAKRAGATFPVFLASSGSITDKYWTWGIPVTYFIDKKGLIVGRAIGPRDWASDSASNIINALLEEK